MKPSLPKPLPCLAFPDGTFFCLPHSESYQFPGTMGYHSSCGEWLVFIHDGVCYLKDPFSNITLTLPDLSRFCRIDEPVEIINRRVNPEYEMPYELLNLYPDMSIGMVIMCSTSIVAATVNIGPLKTVALCRPGVDSWLVSGLGSKVVLRGMIFYEGKLFALDTVWKLLVVVVGEDNNNGNLSISRIERLIETKSLYFSFISGASSYFDYFLVECNGALLLLFRTIFGMSSDGDNSYTSPKPVGIKFEVFKADFRSSQWEDVTSLGDDVALFVSKSYCLSAFVSQCNNMKGECIWFLNDGSCGWFWKGQSNSYLAYDMIDGSTYSPLPDVSFKSEKTPVTWLVPR